MVSTIVVLVAAGALLAIARPVLFNTPLHITITNESGANFTVELSLCDTFDCNVYWTALVAVHNGQADRVEPSCVHGDNVLFASILGFHDAKVIKCGPGHAAVEVRIGVNELRISLVPP